MQQAKNEAILNALTDKAQEVVNTLSAPLLDILNLIRKNTDLESGTICLSNDTLCMLAIRIPAECGYLQSNINSKIIYQRLRDIVTQNEVTDSIVLLRESGGDARERQRRAEALQEIQLLTDEAENQIIQALQQLIVRADKTYEGIKKIIDAKNREANLDRKPGYSMTN